MERLLDKIALLAGAVACLMLDGAPSAAVIAAMLLVLIGSMLYGVAPLSCRPALIIACSIISAAVPGAAPILVLPAYDGVRLIQPDDHGDHGSPEGARADGRGTSLARLAGIAPGVALLAAIVRGGSPMAFTGVAICLLALACLLSHRTGSALARRRHAQASRDDLTARTRALGKRNRELIHELARARERGEEARIDLPPEFSQLTPREIEVARLVAEGLDNREIAARAFMGEGTVRNTISATLTKLGLKNRTQIAVAYWRARAR